MSDTPTRDEEAFRHPFHGTPVYRCSYCGRFYSARTKHKHRVCHMIEEKQNAGQ
jgi:hypothetical protein